MNESNDAVTSWPSPWQRGNFDAALSVYSPQQMADEFTMGPAGSRYGKDPICEHLEVSPLSKFYSMTWKKLIMPTAACSRK